jgi:hypothetical protein
MTLLQDIASYKECNSQKDAEKLSLYISTLAKLKNEPIEERASMLIAKYT